MQKMLFNNQLKIVFDIQGLDEIITLVFHETAKIYSIKYRIYTGIHIK